MSEQPKLNSIPVSKADSAESLVRRAQLSTLPSHEQEDTPHYIVFLEEKNIYHDWPKHSERGYCHCCDISQGKYIPVSV
jgi:hypothetical protein